jgi:Signal transduction histidine kinase
VVRRVGSNWERVFSYAGSRVDYADGKALAFLSLQDITARVRADAALRDSHDELERQVAARTLDLRAALVRAEAADRIKSAFLATMSHELRTPLNSIIGFTGILLQKLAGPLNDEQAKQLGMVQGSARHLLELISDVLDISKIEAEQLDVRAEDFDLLASLERVVASVLPLAQKKAIALDVQCAPSIAHMHSDRRRVEQILINLLNNAIKFTERGTVCLRVETVADYRAGAASSPCPAVRFCVIDSGIGIKPADLDLLFQPFRQVDSGMSRQHEGTGLGLAICRRLARLLGGDIEVASEPGIGSTFTAMMPLTLV